MSCKLHVYYATKNKSGRENQDNCMVDKFLACASGLSSICGELITDMEEKRLFLVSDGAGGTFDGEKASEITVSTIFSYLDAIKADDGDYELIKALDDANKKVTDFFENIKLSGAATVSGLLFSGKSAVSFNAGDSPVFMLSEGNFERLHKEHTVAAEKYGYDSASKESEESNTITHYMGRNGISGSEQTYFRRVDIAEGSVFLIASDGVEKGISDKKIKTILTKKRGNTAKKLVDMAYRGGACDDITAIVIRVI